MNEHFFKLLTPQASIALGGLIGFAIIGIWMFIEFVIELLR